MQEEGSIRGRSSYLFFSAVALGFALIPHLGTFMSSGVWNGSAFEIAILNGDLLYTAHIVLISSLLTFLYALRKNRNDALHVCIFAFGLLMMVLSLIFSVRAKSIPMLYTDVPGVLLGLIVLQFFFNAYCIYSLEVNQSK